MKWTIRGVQLKRRGDGEEYSNRWIMEEIWHKRKEHGVKCGYCLGATLMGRSTVWDGS